MNPRRLAILVIACFALGRSAAADSRILFDGVKINGQPVRLAIDTGAEISVIFRPVADRLGLKCSDPAPGVRPAPGGVSYLTTEPVEIVFGSQTMTSRLAVIDIPASLHQDVDGLVGWGPMRSHFFIFNAASSTLKIDDTGHPPTPAAAWQPLPVRKDAKMLVLDIPGPTNQPGAILIDTGSPNGVRLSPARWRAWRAAHADAPVTLDAYYTPGIGLVVKETAWAKELTLGSLKLSDVPVQEAVVEVLMISGYEATLGLAALNRQNIVIDGQNGVAYFSKTTLPIPSPAHNRLGAVFVPSDMQHDPLEAHVVKGSPAEAAGIADGDILLKIDDLEVTQWRSNPAVMPMTRFWERPAGTKMVLLLKRANKEFTSTVTLRNLIGPDASMPIAK
jgi:hypothetical protein